MMRHTRLLPARIIGAFFLPLSIAAAAATDSANEPPSSMPAPRLNRDDLGAIQEVLERIRQDYVDPVDEHKLVAGCRESTLQLKGKQPEIPQPTQPTQVGAPTSTSTLDEIAEVLYTIRQQGAQSVPNRKLIDACLMGMLQALDPQSRYLDQAEFKGQQSNLPGVGLEVGMVGGRPSVVTPIENGPAARAGLKAGDTIVMIDHVSTEGLSLSEVVGRLRGARGSSVTLTVEHAGTRESEDFVLGRELVRLESVVWRLVESGYAWIRIRQFQEATVRDLARALDASYSQSQGSPKGLILDLRGNPGGLLPACVGVSAAFLPMNALVVETKGRTRNSSMRLSANPGNYTRSGSPDVLKGLPPSIKTVPMAVLVDHKSAACSEIVAAALQDHQRAKILGASTFGQGTVATIWALKGNETGLNLTTARFFRPNGQPIAGAGVTPDVTLADKGNPPSSFGSADDLALLEAIRFLGDKSAQGRQPADSADHTAGKQGSAFPDLGGRIADLIRANDAARPAPPILDGERVGLAREVVEAALVREKWSSVPAAFEEAPIAANVPREFADAIRITGAAVFQPDAIVELFEHKLAEALDAVTLQVGLQWERSEVGRRINRLEVEGGKPEQSRAREVFARQFLKDPGTVDDARARACDRVDVLGNETDTKLPVLEATVAGAAMARLTQSGQPVDMSGIERAIAASRPALHEAARQAELASCLFTLRDLKDAEVEQWLAFLRSDAGGRYARGANAALRDALLARTEVFTRVLLEVAGQIKGRAKS